MEQEAISARIVAIPKNPEAAKTDAKAKPKSDRIGDILRHARLERNEDLYQIAEYLCIKPNFLVALENSRYDELPADAYVIGFLRTYATFLGIDGKEAVDRYRYEMAGRRKKPVLSMPIPLSEGRAPGSLIIVGATIAVLLIYALWYGISSANRTELNVPPPLPATRTSPVSSIDGGSASAAGLTAPVTTTSNGGVTSSSTITASSNTGVIPPAAPGIVVTASEPASAARPEPSPIAPGIKDAKDQPDDGKKQVYGDPAEAAHLIIRATQNSHITITDASGKTVFDHALKPGDIYKVPNQQGLTLSSDNGGGLALSFDGADLPKIATGSHPVKNIPLNTEHAGDEPSSD